MTALTLSFLDRQMIAILVEPIKADLNISDTQIGLLQGLAFSMFYALMGLPIAKLADAKSRKNLVAGGIFLWSLMTCLSSTARNYTMLFLARIGVGVGEATLSPSTYSMLADYFPKEKLSGAMSVFQLGIFFGAGVAFVFGGFLIGYLEGLDPATAPFFLRGEPWRIAFVIAGLPGIVLALLIYFCVREPERRASPGESAGDTSIIGTLKMLAAMRRSYWGLFGGFALHAIALNALLAWLPTVFIRTFDYAPHEAATIVGLSMFVFGAAGALSGGRLSDMLFRRGSDSAPLVVGVIAALGTALPLVLLMFGLLSKQAAPWVLGVCLYFTAFPAGPGPAAVQLITPVRMRAKASALYLITLGLVGLTLGPLLPPLVSDHILHDDQQLAMGLAVVCILVCAVSATLFQLGRNGFKARYRELYITEQPEPA
ncbi:MAG: MFS transporter [Hyphomonas sp.]|nr:MFS transporter [Hyphomonas sp.]